MWYCDSMNNFDNTYENAFDEGFANTNERYLDGTPHHPKSKILFKFLSDIDFSEGDTFGWKSGGDGDNGELLMYQLDTFFEHDDYIRRGNQR